MFQKARARKDGCAVAALLVAFAMQRRIFAFTSCPAPWIRRPGR